MRVLQLGSPFCGLLMSQCRNPLQKKLIPLTACKQIRTTSSKAETFKVQEGEDFWEKNRRFRRPLSPHLTIYRPQLTSMLSITHRGTGAFMASVLYGGSMVMLLLPNSYPHYLELLGTTTIGSSIVLLAKLGLSFSFFFHLNNGIRHLFWDLGYGFILKDLYKSGWFVLGSALAAASLVSLM